MLQTKCVLSKCWACSIKNWEPCSHCRSSNWSRVWGIEPLLPPSIDVRPPLFEFALPVLLALACFVKKLFHNKVTLAQNYLPELLLYDATEDQSVAYYHWNWIYCALPTQNSNGQTFFVPYSNLGWVDCPTCGVHAFHFET